MANDDQNTFLARKTAKQTSANTMQKSQKEQNLVPKPPSGSKPDSSVLASRRRQFSTASNEPK